VEFGPAEALDTLALRPFAMYVGPLVVGNVMLGVLVGKLVADVTFYGFAIVGYEILVRRRARIVLPVAPMRAVTELNRAAATPGP
jgi:hypothetical protein